MNFPGIGEPFFRASGQGGSPPWVSQATKWGAQPTKNSKNVAK